MAEDKITLNKFSKDGKEAGQVEVSSDVFGIEPNVHVLHLAVRRELANGRAGTACTKTRSEVRGGGKKPWKQKGTGRARAGSIRSPLWVGGGVTFGPKPRDYSFNLPRKVRVLAMRSSLSAAQGKFKVLEDFSFLTGPKTKEVADLLSSFGLIEKKVLILTDYKATENQHIYLASRNLPGIKLCLPHNLSAKDLLDADAVIASNSAVQEINERYASYV
ncbi:50S ribosomal protein L4 [Vampirovibrio sp.]|uniref:50S ribosomal protein L4 n=1 Tax=Vampirovibrio sp. TaxID=2717857 RepID=UPI003593D617